MPTVGEVFARARRLQGAERARCLDDDCGTDAALRAEVESLLAEIDGAPIVDTHAVARKVHDVAARAQNGSDSATTPLPERIGPFRIVRVLGEGGMGIVYEAEQIATVKRRVALKVIKRGMDSSEVLARFDTERQALSVMDHPHVARVLDVGATDDGRPWFAMELVDGLPFTVHCDRERLSTHERLALFRDACQAVQHAHQKGVIHRDLKPTNILVAQRDGRADVKVIDFGVAKAVGEALTDNAHATKAGHVLGTPAYMSPEQAEGSRLDVDTRTDVYSLGVILYELLAGRLPFDGKSTSMRGWLDRLASGRTTPAAPSARVTSLQGANATAVADSRRVTQRALAKELRGDLDWIVLRAMQPDRDLRYESAGGLAADVQRHLDDEPVEARPPSATYRLRKFVRRHRAGVVAAGAVVAAVLLGVVGTVHGLVRARHEAKTANEALDFLVGMFQEADPHLIPDELSAQAPDARPRAETLTAKEILERGAKRLETRLMDEPEARARLLAALGRTNGSLGLLDVAARQLRAALELRREALGPDHPEVAASLNGLGDALQEQGDLAGARELYEQALAINRQVLDSDAPGMAETLDNLGRVIQAQGDLEGARNLLGQALAVRRRAFGKDSPNLALGLNNLAGALFAQGDMAGARRLFEEALEIDRKALGPAHAEVATNLNNLGSVLQAQGDLAGARTHLEQAVEIGRTALGPRHPSLAVYLDSLGLILRDLGELEAARRLIDEALEIERETLGPDHQNVAMSVGHSCSILQAQGDLAGARALCEESLAILRKALGPDHAEVAGALEALASVIEAQGDLPGAQRLFEQSLESARRALGPDHPKMACAHHCLGYNLGAQGDLAGARKHYEEALAIWRKSVPSDSTYMAITVSNLASVLRKQGDPAAARPFYEEATAIYRKAALPAGDPSLAQALAGLGAVEHQLGELAAAEAHLRESLRILEQGDGQAATNATTIKVREELAATLRAQGRTAEADALLRENAKAGSPDGEPPAPP